MKKLITQHSLVATKRKIQRYNKSEDPQTSKIVKDIHNKTHRSKLLLVIITVILIIIALILIILISNTASG